ncbi:amidohydrolase [Erysipelothrix sp. HDW6C]|nr:amidohydrolase [Erysipelothrix sp. HDW6C]
MHVKLMREEMIETRRYLHQHPELSGKEYETSAYLKTSVRNSGLPVTDVPNSTGFYAVLDTGREGKTVALRTDIDALPITEDPENLNQKRVCVSRNDGVMHACGHDGHMAILLAAMKILVSVRETLTGKIVFVFEEGEEIGSGIHPMIAALSSLQIDAIYGMHLTAFMPTGTINVDEGPRMAGFIDVEFDVVGRGGHGSRPDLSINPLFAVGNILTGLGTAWANQIDISKTVTLGLTQVHAGAANNVFADSAFVGGSLRYFDNAEGIHALEVLKHVAQKTAEAHRCNVVFRETTGVKCKPVINDVALAKIVRSGAEKMYEGSVVEGEPWYASESFGFYDEIAPIVFAFIGCGNEDVGSGAVHHNNHFDIDEASLEFGLGTMLQFVFELQD